MHVTLRRGDPLPQITLPHHVTLAAAMIRPQRFDWVVEKAFELGCRRLVPIVSERTVAHYIKDARKQQARWTEIARSAAKQSGLPWLPEVTAPLPLPAMLAEVQGPLYYCWEGLAMDRVPEAPRTTPGGRHCTVVIGPEGGFSKAEHEQIVARKPVMLSLGPLILRSETAALVALAKVMS
jgi:16S rRNA (uracil1498-N3)-methyltransferase